MDSFNFYDIKAEKANAILRHNKLGRKIANFFRLVEALIVLVIVSRLSFTIPNVVKNSGDFLKDVSVFFFSPRFVFVLGNLIVVVLFAKSGKFSPRDSTKKSNTSFNNDLYDEFLKQSAKSEKVSRTKQVAAERSVKRSSSENCLEIKRFSNPASTTRVLKRCQTEKNGRMIVHRLPYKEFCDQNGIKEELELADHVNKINDQKCNLHPEDLMSGEEFRLKVEAFIARQQRFRSMEDGFSGDEL